MIQHSLLSSHSLQSSLGAMGAPLKHYKSLQLLQPMKTHDVFALLLLLTNYDPGLGHSSFQGVSHEELDVVNLSQTLPGLQAMTLSETFGYRYSHTVTSLGQLGLESSWEVAGLMASCCSLEFAETH